MDIIKQNKLDLAGKLQKKRRQKIMRFLVFPSIGIFLVVLFMYFSYNFPWDWQLFFRWLIRGGNVTAIPERLHQDISDLCYTANLKGEVKARDYLGNIEVADALGTFECKASDDGKNWIIHDEKSFYNPEEAIMGSELAVFLVSIFGTDYSYEINAIVPRLPQKNIPSENYDNGNKNEKP